MRLTNNYELRTIGGQYVLVPSAQNELDFTRMLVLNETALTLWECMSRRRGQTPADLAAALAEGYSGVDRRQAERDVEEFLQELKRLGALAEEKE